MKRGTVQRRLSRLEDDLRGLLANWPIPAFQVATLEEVEKMLKLLSETNRHMKISPEQTPELWALFETLNKRLRTRLGQE